MNNRIRILLATFATILLLPATVSAQASDKKETAVVDRFDRTREVPRAYRDLIRDKVISALIDRGRNIVVDGETMQVLDRSNGWSEWINDLSWMSRQQELTAERAALLDPENTRYIITGAVLGYELHRKQDDDKNIYHATIRLALSGYDLKFGKSFTVQEFELKGEDPKPDEADRKAIASLTPRMVETFIDCNIKIECPILELCEATRRGVVKECYINVGTELGAAAGDTFKVYREIPVGATFAREQVGRLRINEVQTADVSRCTISGGREQIVSALQAGETLIAVSEGKALFY